MQSMQKIERTQRTQRNSQTKKELRPINASVQPAEKKIKEEN